MKEEVLEMIIVFEVWVYMEVFSISAFLKQIEAFNWNDFQNIASK